MTTSSQGTIKGNWIHAATIQYIKQLHPEVWEEAQQAARQRWTEEHPNDPWRPKAKSAGIDWTQDDSA